MSVQTTDADYRASFDLTTFGDPETWERILDEFGLVLEENANPFDWDHVGWYWTNEDLVVHTYANPLTGERAGMPDREPEPGYAAYIHVEGEKDAVREFYETARRWAEHVKEGSLGRWIV